MTYLHSLPWLDYFIGLYLYFAVFVCFRGAVELLGQLHPDLPVPRFALQPQLSPP